MTRMVHVALLCMAALAPGTGTADILLSGSAGRIEAEAWSVSGFEASIDLSESGTGGQFRIANILLPESGQSFDDTRVSCRRIELTTHTVSCPQGEFEASLPRIGRKQFSGGFLFNHASNEATIRVAGMELAGGRLAANVKVGKTGIDLEFNGAGLQASGLLELAAGFFDGLPGLTANGGVDVSGSVSLPSAGPPRIAATLALADVSLANDAGTVAAEGVAGRFDVDAEPGPDGTRFAVRFDGDSGEAYVEPVYLNLSEHAFSLAARGDVNSALDEIALSYFDLQQAGLIDAAGSAFLGLPTDADATISADIELRDASIEFLYDSIVRIALAGTFLGSLDTEGRLSGSVKLTDSELQSATLAVSDAILDDRRGRFSVYGVRGYVDWHKDRDEVRSPSRLAWDSGTVYSILVGGGELPLQLGGYGVEFLSTLRLPTLGGALVVHELALQNFGSDAATGRFDAELEPIQLGQLTSAFGWPAFSGTLTGRLPRLQFADDTITVSGTLGANAFDGTIEMTDFRIEQPFGRVPRLQTELVVQNLDLQRVTEVFSFGLIQGRLSGEVAGLRMENWRPVAMDMRFFTPPGDRSPHRISQRAVENIASVGGSGAAGVLSTGFLRFFEVFAYDRIGLRCVLENGVCAMSGAGPVTAGPGGAGYYIVRGSGVPRIDVVGYRETVSWDRLVQQLAAITRGGSPVVN